MRDYKGHTCLPIAEYDKNIHVQVAWIGLWPSIVHSYEKHFIDLSNMPVTFRLKTNATLDYDTNPDLLICWDSKSMSDVMFFKSVEDLTECMLLYPNLFTNASEDPT